MTSLVASNPPGKRAAIDVESWAAHQRELLEMEKEAEIEVVRDQLASLSPSECEACGLSLLQLCISNKRTTLFGRCNIAVSRINGNPLETTSFKVGDEIQLTSQKVHSSTGVGDVLDGVVSAVSKTELEFVCDNDEIELSEPLRLNMKVSEQSHQKLVSVLSKVEKMTNPLINILFNNGYIATPLSTSTFSTFGTNNIVEKVSIEPINSLLNSSQVEAVEFALGSPHLALIHGPPGTGKTSTVTELIVQAVTTRKSKVLVACPSNVAVDNIIQRVVALSMLTSGTSKYSGKVNVVRLGHPARITDSIQPYCLDSLILRHDGTEIVQDVRKELDDLRGAITKCRDKGRKKQLRGDVRALKKEARLREDKVVQDILRTRDVIFCTNVGASSKLLKDMLFDMVVIDEAAQALEVSCWIPMLYSSKCILAGDHCQLPPTVKSSKAEAGGLAITLFERIMNTPALEGVSKLLTTQYRMNHIISDWASTEMYHNKLLTGDSVHNHTLAALAHPAKGGPGALGSCSLSVGNASTTSTLSTSAACASEELQHVLVDERVSAVMMLIDTAGCDMEEDASSSAPPSSILKHAKSHRNESEARVVCAHIELMVAAGISPQQIGVVTPYNGQLELLRSLLLEKHPLLEIRTVDGFQGGEKEAIVLSLVRSNPHREVGFLSDVRRINVAVTRARRHVAVVCDTDTCCANGFLSRLIEYISTKGEHRSALEYIEPEAISATYVHARPCNPSVLPSELVKSSTVVNSGSAIPMSVPVLQFPKCNAIGNIVRKFASAKDTLSDTYNTWKISVIESKKLYQRLLTAHKAKAGVGEGVQAGNEGVHWPYHTFYAEMKKHYVLELTISDVPAVKPTFSNMVTFPPSFTSGDRKVVHSECEELGLFHWSNGEGNCRVITMSWDKCDVSKDKGTVLSDGDGGSKTESTCGSPCIPDGGDVSVSTCPDDVTNPTSPTSCMQHAGDTSSSMQRPGDTTSSMQHAGDTTSSMQHADDTGNSTNTSTAMTKAGSKKSKKKKSNSNKTCAIEQKTYYNANNTLKKGIVDNIVKMTQDTSLDDDDVLNAAIAANKTYQDQTKYRISCTAMPNPEANKIKAQMKTRMEEARLARSSAFIQQKQKAEAEKVPHSSMFSSSVAASTPSTGRSYKKTVVKPPGKKPNFGGGKVGGLAKDPDDK